ncbi:piggyBac transposable element-derived protein 4 [Trichonephila clavipes]|uniref:PiggyBac transposable element-derived protein 4 n=1 Tax=Trichonephila clavipes TaxID=2585209 RepID=A0A8X6W086_TRICX|nr:piggyBac transposable element-derived protein 4 [Trichonephila clavipes]
MVLLYVAYILYCKSVDSQPPKQVRMELTGKIISENHSEEFPATSRRPSISPSPLRLTSRHFPDVFPATEKKSNPTRLCSRKRDSRGKPRELLAMDLHFEAQSSDDDDICDVAPLPEITTPLRRDCR